MSDSRSELAWLEEQRRQYWAEFKRLLRLIEPSPQERYRHNYDLIDWSKR